MLLETIENVNQDGNTIPISSLSSPVIIGYFIREIYQRNERGYKDFILDFSGVGAVYPNVCTPLAGLINFYRVNRGLSFEYRNVPDFLSRIKMLDPSAIQDDNSHRKYPLDVVWQFSSAEEVNSLVDAYLDSVSRSVACEKGVIEGLDWCLNEIMDNILRHAGTRHGFVMGQIHSTSRHIAVCIYDYGQGIFNSLRTSQKHYPVNAVDAITIALQKGVTRDENDGQGWGLWALNNIIRLNSGRLNITSGSGYVSTGSDGQKTSDTMLFLSRENNCTTVDFQIDFSKEFSIVEALDGHEVTNFRIENLEDENNNIIYKLADKSSGTGTRESGSAIRNEIINISNQTTSVIILDFTGVSLVSSSFADELVGKLVVKYGFVGFTQRFRLFSMNETIQAITNRSVIQRLTIAK